MKYPLMNKLSKQLFDSVFELSEKELQSLIIEIKTLSRTNCWWISYWMKDTVYEVAKGFLEKDPLLIMEKDDVDE